jgi:hypothetical protein
MLVIRLTLNLLSVMLTEKKKFFFRLHINRMFLLCSFWGLKSIIFHLIWLKGVPMSYSYLNVTFAIYHSSFEVAKMGPNLKKISIPLFSTQAQINQHKLLYFYLTKSKRKIQFGWMIYHQKIDVFSESKGNFSRN